MSNNGIPPLNDWQADNYPVIYDEGADELQYVKTGNKTTINTGGSSYLVYTALLRQVGTDAPLATVLQNTLGGAVVWTRTDVGEYLATLAGAFLSFKVIAPPFASTSGGTPVIQPMYGATIDSYGYQIVRESDNSMRLSVYDNPDFNNIELSTVTSNYLLIQFIVYP